MTTSQSLFSTYTKKLFLFHLPSIIFQTCPYYFTSNNNINELYHIKRKHHYCIAFVSAVSKDATMITNSLGLFGLLRVRTEAPKKQQVISFCLCLTVHIKDAKHTHKQNQQSRLCKSRLVQNTCLKSMEEVVQILQHMSNLFNFFPESN